MPVSPALLTVLQEHGHTGAHAHQQGLSRASDEVILAHARQEGYVIIITADLDFPRLLAIKCQT
jgi:predicted nuclease of predicted toxin-antitoxin system